jgi:hypothetical protein
VPFVAMQKRPGPAEGEARPPTAGALKPTPYRGATVSEIPTLADEVGPICERAAAGPGKAEARMRRLAKAPAVRAEAMSRPRRRLPARVNSPEMRDGPRPRAFCVILDAIRLRFPSFRCTLLRYGRFGSTRPPASFGRPAASAGRGFNPKLKAYAV